MNTSNGKNVLSGVYGATPTGSCASSSSFKSKSYAPGVLFTGTGPYYLLPQSNVDIRSLLSYTPLLNNPNSFGYFISIDAIVIKNRSIYIPAAATAKLSTTEPYTTLRTDIFTRVVRRFSMVTKRISTAKPIAPFGLCFRTSTNGTKVNLKFPNIYFSLQGGKTWTVSAANSIKKMTKDVACLAMVDGGATSAPAIKIGTFQFEDNFVASGLRINMSKSKIMSVLVDSDKVKCVASELGCLILKTPFSYLGSKVGGSMSRVHTWNETSLDSSFRRVPRDRWIWALESSGDFFAASVRKVIDDKSLLEVDSKTRWIKYVPIKVNVHAWKVKTDSLPTRQAKVQDLSPPTVIQQYVIALDITMNNSMLNICTVVKIATMRILSRLNQAAELEEEGGKYGVGQIRLNLVVIAEDTATSAPIQLSLS
uniref:Basic 7S globulin 2-like n=1 Tax=Tanacetum cinerariifolium TaxID=118510 RepID=A0A6L2KMG7_TANCI|nr:basic 7S globulin 2-like [Tanacetum cinerariifolium]